MKDQQTKLIRIAAELLRGANLPSEMAEDYPQKTYSAGRVAQMMESSRDRLRQIAIELGTVSDSLTLGATEKCGSRGMAGGNGCVLPKGHDGKHEYIG